MAGEIPTAAGPIQIRICAGDDNYVLDWCPWQDWTDLSDPAHRLLCSEYRNFNSLLQRSYGGHAIAAWDGPKLIAILTFAPEGAIVPPPGRTEPRPCALEPRSCLEYADRLDLSCESKVLLLGCLGLYTRTTRYRRQGIGSALVIEALHWARKHDYRVVKAIARPDGGSPEEWDKSPAPEEGFWRRLGFTSGSREAGRVEMICRLGQ